MRTWITRRRGEALAARRLKRLDDRLLADVGVERSAVRVREAGGPGPAPTRLLRRSPLRAKGPRPT